MEGKEKHPHVSQMRGVVPSSIVSGLLLSVLSLLVMAVLAEIGLRAFGYDPLRDLKNGREFMLRRSSNTDMKYELVPGASGYAWDTKVEINAYGRRGRAGFPGKFPGYRVVILGDSLTFGNYLPVEATYPQLMQQMLDPSAAAYEVLNFGVGGYDVLQESALLEFRGVDYRPDLVVVGFCLNDVGIVSPNLEYLDRVREYRSSFLLRSRVAQFVAGRIDRIRIGSWMEEKNRPEVFARDYQGRIAPLSPEDGELRELMDRVPDIYPSFWYGSAARVGRLRYAFERIAALDGRGPFSVVIVIFPGLEGEPGRYPHEVAHRIVTHEARRVGFDVIDLLPVFMAAGMDSLKILEGDLVHPNEKGHRIVAEALARYVREKRRL